MSRANEIRDRRKAGKRLRGRIAELERQSVAMDLEGIFTRAGTPKGIVEDCDATLGKGVRLWPERQAEPVHVIEDIGHSMSSALWDEFTRERPHAGVSRT